MFSATAARKLLLPALATLAALVVLLGLGRWQLERGTWKEGLLAAIAARTTAAPVSLADAVARLGKGDDVEYLRVRARGTFLNGEERYYYAPDPAGGPGFHVYTPFAAAGAGVLLVNRGFVPDALRDPAARKAGLVDGETEVEGLLRKPGKQGFMAPDNDPGRNIWYWRDYDGMLASIERPGDLPRLPLFLDATEPAPGGWPKGGATRLDIPNRHLEYALTWFGLAGALVAVFAAYAATRLRPGDPGEP